MLHLKSLVADFLALLVPDDLGLGVTCGLADKRGHPTLHPRLVFWGSGEPGWCWGKEVTNIMICVIVCMCTM